MAAGERDENGAGADKDAANPGQYFAGNSPASRTRPLAPAYKNIQVNFCKTPGCQNFGVPAAPVIPRLGGRGRTESSPDGYQIKGQGRGSSGLYCQHCGKSSRLKSNKAIFEELRRQGRFLFAPSPVRCPREECPNHRPRSDLKKLFRRYGTSEAGSIRFQCRSCKATFSIAKATHRQRRTHVNTSILEHLVAKTPLQQIARLHEISFPTLYGKIDWLYQQCALFAAAREARLGELGIRDMRIAIDRQDHVINWRRSANRQSIQIATIASAERSSGYLLGWSAAIDPDLDLEEVEAARTACGDAKRQPHLREWARVWTAADYEASLGNAPPEALEKAPGRYGDEIEVSGTARDDLEVTEAIVEGQQLPSRGVMVHADYLTHGHFHLLRHLLRGVPRLHISIDADAGVLNACLGAFADRVAAGDVDVVQVRILKELTNDRRQRIYAAAQRSFEAQRARFPEASSDWDLAHAVMTEAVAAARAASPEHERRLQGVQFPDPRPQKAEPERAMRLVTAFDHLSDEEVATKLLLGTLWPVDTAFAALRHRVAMFSRGVSAARRARRLWHVNAPYDPRLVGKLLEINRVTWNYLRDPRKKGVKAPAERLGLAQGEVRPDHILGFDIRDLVERQWRRSP